jgi:hypothetical protein
VVEVREVKVYVAKAIVGAKGLPLRALPPHNHIK